ncbi:uncharacterized protein [Coffea arabica]|uniref:Uncharacterized protein n=1 Tax=Coffea arabica TaxID=13443 RepID=A0A6P6SQL3_COFAR|nr:uncharacterized protein LOC113693707 [Coffea arabica]
MTAPNVSRERFFEEYVHGAGSNKQQEAIPKQFMNKKTKFVYSDSSEDEDGDDDGIGNNIHRSTEEKDLRTDNITDANCETLVDEKLGSQNEDDSSVQEEIQEDKDGKEEVTKKHKFQEGEAGEQPIKKQCVEISSSKSPNLASSKMEEKSVDKLIEAELAELGDKSKNDGHHLILYSPHWILDVFMSSLDLSVCKSTCVNWGHNSMTSCSVVLGLLYLSVDSLKEFQTN